MSKSRLEELADTEYASMMPYYSVADGGYISDEYTLLPYASALNANTEFGDNLKKEELLEETVDGVVIGACADGDHILLCKDGRVIRFSHEAPEITNEWSSIAQFVFEAITEYE